MVADARSSGKGGLLTMCCWSNKGHAVCCTFFSLISAIILFLLGGLIRNQPEFHIRQFPNGTVEPANKMFSAAGMYLATMVISMVFWLRHNNAEREAERRHGRRGGGGGGGGLAGMDGLGGATFDDHGNGGGFGGVRRRPNKKKKKKRTLVRESGSQKGLEMFSSNTGETLLADADRESPREGDLIQL